MNRFPFVKLMGMKLLSCSGGMSVMRCRVRQALKNSGGTLHGRVMGTLVDMSVATALRCRPAAHLPDDDGGVRRSIC